MGPETWIKKWPGRLAIRAGLGWTGVTVYLSPQVIEVTGIIDYSVFFQYRKINSSQSASTA